jgi:DNA-binding NarL/FixJ family response regulator
MTGVSYARLLGDAAASLGERAQAHAYYARALEACATIGFRPEIALSHLGLGELLLRAGARERVEALAHLDFAIDEFRAMGMQPALERTLALCEHQESTDGPQIRPVYPGGLSPCEVEVLRLVAAGKSNQQIADTLVFSPNTVLRHISYIFSKIGAANRTEAATFALQQGLLE